MDMNERISQLEDEVAKLREHCEKADAALALMIGMLTEASTVNFTVDARSVLGNIGQSGWAATLLERMSEGQELLRRAQQGR